MLQPYQNPYVDPYPGATQSAIDARRKYALGILQQGTDSSPTKANAIGAVARALQGALGGYFAGQVEQSDIADRAKMLETLKGFGSGGQTPGPQAALTPGIPQPPVTPVASADLPQTPNQRVAAGFDAMNPPPQANPSMPRGLRNNNPLNIEAGGFTKSQPGFAGSDGRFAQFQTPQQGIQAANSLIDSYARRGLNTPAAIIGRWAPISDGNNVSAYAADVAGKLGIGPNDPIPPQMRPQLIAAMAAHENGRPMDPQVVAAALSNGQQPYQVASIDPNVGGPPAAPTGQIPVQPPQGQAGAPPLPPQGAAPSMPPQPQQVAQAAPMPAQGPQQNPMDLAARLMATRSGQQIGQALAAQYMQRQTAPPTFGTVGHDQFGNPTMGWIDANHRTVTPVNGQISQTQTGAPGQTAANGDEFLKTLDKPVADQVKALAEGRMAFPAGFALKSPYWQRMVQYVSQYDPTFDAVNYNARTKTRNDFTSGKSAQSINAMNTVAGHLETLSDAADALNNTSYPMVNSVTNYAANAVGDPRIKQFDTTKKAVVDELTRVWRGNGGSEGDIKTWSDQLNAANSPQQLHAVIGQLGELIQSKIGALGEQYKQGMGTTAQPIQLVTPKSAAVFEKLKKRAGGEPSAGNAEVPSAPAATKTINGKTYINQNGQWYEQ